MHYRYPKFNNIIFTITAHGGIKMAENDGTKIISTRERGRYQYRVKY